MAFFEHSALSRLIISAVQDVFLYVQKQACPPAKLVGMGRNLDA